MLVVVAAGALGHPLNHILYWGHQPSSSKHTAAAGVASHVTPGALGTTAAAAEHTAAAALQSRGRHLLQLITHAEPEDADAAGTSSTHEAQPAAAALPAPPGKLNAAVKADAAAGSYRTIHITGVTSAAPSDLWPTMGDSAAGADSSDDSSLAHLSKVNHYKPAHHHSHTIIIPSDELQVPQQQQQQQEQVVKPAWCSKAEGKVSRVDCWLDTAGTITGVQLTDDMGLHQPGICQTQGPPSAGGYLDEFESIVEIRACK
jgi:hypothetical protein